jgi:hypothetical protein
MRTMNMPGFTADSALSRAGRGYLGIANALTDDGRASVLLAKTKVSGPGGTQCELDATLTVEDEGGTSTTNIWKCTTTVDMSDGGSGQGSSGDPSDGGGGGGSGSGGTKEEKRKRRAPKNRIERDGVNWRHQCARDLIQHCCRDKANKCNEKCTSTQCRNECHATWKVCSDEGNPRGPVVCSIGES